MQRVQANRLRGRSFRMGPSQGNAHSSEGENFI
jgi:hypothetical protein